MRALKESAIKIKPKESKKEDAMTEDEKAMNEISRVGGGLENSIFEDFNEMGGEDPEFDPDTDFDLSF